MTDLIKRPAIAALDVPAEQVAAEVKRLNKDGKKSPAEVLQQAREHSASASDRIAYSLDLFLIEHPEACSTEDDYPDWVVAEWNRLHPVGAPVVAFPITRSDERLETRTRSEAWVLGGHTPVVLVDGYEGGIALTHIDADGGTR